MAPTMPSKDKEKRQGRETEHDRSKATTKTKKTKLKPCKRITTPGPSIIIEAEQT